MVLALDCGTTWCKAVAFARGGRILATVRQPSGVEDLANLGASALSALASLANRLPSHCAPQAVSVDAAIYPAICLDEGDAPFALPLLWEPDAATRAAVAADPGWGPAGMAAWGNGGPVALRLAAMDATRIGRVGSLVSYLVWTLTGRWVIDPASGPGGMAWPPVAALSKAPELPAVVPFGAVAGGLTGGAARATGLRRGLPVVVGGHDGACANLGAGAVTPGDCCLTLSTNFVPRGVAAAPIRGLFGYPVGLHGWAAAQPILQAGHQIDLGVAALDGGPEAVAASRHEALARAAGRTEAPEVPYLPPERTGEQASRCRDLLRRGWQPGQVYRGLIRGALVAMLDLLAVERAAGLAVDRFVATGGLSRSALVMGELEAMLGAPVKVAPRDATARGAAAGAAVVAGWASDIEAGAAELSGS